jgi:hypothetical protein
MEGEMRNAAGVLAAIAGYFLAHYLMNGGFIGH